MKRFEQYINDVTKGKQPAGHLMKLAIKRHLEDRERDGIVWKPKKGYDIVQIIETAFNFWDDRFAGKPVRLEPWQVFSLMLKYGWYYDDGRRRFTKSYQEVARKNGKTIMKAWEALYHVMRGNPASNVFCGATTESQARLLTNAAGQTVRASPDLAKHFDLYKWGPEIKMLHYKVKGSNIKTLTSQAGKQDGLKPTYAIMDEFHEHPDLDLYNVILSAMSVSLNPLLDIITTAGFKKHYPCYYRRAGAIDVLEGRIVDDDMLVLIATIDQDDDWRDEEVWYKANPNLGISQPLTTLRGFARDAINYGGTSEVNFKTKHLNIWTDSEKTWIPKEKWDKGNKNPITLDRREAYAGIQLAATTGSNSLTLCMPRSDSPIVDFRTYYWLPEQSARDDKELWDNYLRWSKQGFLTLTDGNVIDYSFIIQKIFELRDQVDLRTIMFAPHYESAFYPLLDAGFNMEKCANTWQNMTASIRGFEKLIAEDNVNHEGNMMLAYQVGLVAMKTGGDDYVRIDKDNSLGKVDGPVSLIMSYKAMIEAKEQINTGEWDVW